MIYLFVYMSEETNVSLLDQDLLLLVERVHLCIIGLQVEGKPRSIEKTGQPRKYKALFLIEPAQRESRRRPNGDI